MADIDKLKVEIDRDGCIGDGACCSDAPETFEMDDEDKAILKDGSNDSRDAIIEAAAQIVEPPAAPSRRENAVGGQAQAAPGEAPADETDEKRGASTSEER